MSADALDQSWGRISPAAAKASGIKLISGYLSHDPSKNWTATEIRAYHAAGIAVVLNWESEPGRPLLGRQAGIEDATAFIDQAEQLIAEVGYTANSIVGALFSCDRDTTPGQYPAIDDYYLATKQIVTAHQFANGAYGEFDLIEHLHAAGLTTVEWQTLAWSRGLISPEADLYQSSINNTIGGTSVDLDQIRHADTVGAWWPPGHPNDTAGDEMSAAEVADLKAYMDKQQDAIVARVLQDLTNTKDRIKAFEPEILGSGGLRRNIRDSFCALGGQIKTLPDGTSVSSIGAIFTALRARIDQAASRPGQMVDLTAISAAAQAGAAKGINGATIHGGQQ